VTIIISLNVTCSRHDITKKIAQLASSNTNSLRIELGNDFNTNLFIFQGILMFLQNLPTHHWHDEEIGELCAEAFKLKYMFADAPNHLNKKS
jgi:hypothetical protein